MNRPSSDTPPLSICLVCSSGGHFAELFRLREVWSEFDACWVTFDAPNTTRVLASETVYHAYSPTIRNIPNLLRNLCLAWRVVNAHRPRVMVSTGAGVCVPFFLVARLRGVPTIYIESLARIEQLSLTGRLVYPLATEFFVQWPSLATRYRRTVFRGQVL